LEATRLQINLSNLVNSQVWKVNIASTLKATQRKSGDRVRLPDCNSAGLELPTPEFNINIRHH
jgi:hypothetical protein